MSTIAIPCWTCSVTAGAPARRSSPLFLQKRTLSRPFLSDSACFLGEGALLGVLLDLLEGLLAQVVLHLAGVGGGHLRVHP